MRILEKLDSFTFEEHQVVLFVTHQSRWLRHQKSPELNNSQDYYLRPTAEAP